MKRPALIPLVILWLGFTALAQNQPTIVDKTDDYVKVISAAYEKLRAAPYREKIRQVNIRQVNKVKDDLLTTTETTTTEFIAPDKVRRIETRIINFPKTVRLVDPLVGVPLNTRKETITIGSFEFVKVDNENWQKIEKPVKKEADEKSEKPGELGYIINFLGRKKVEDKEFDIYEMIKTKNPSQPKERYWINVSNGLLVKRDYDLQETKDFTTRVEITYEQDASIKIEAPKLNR